MAYVKKDDRPVEFLVSFTRTIEYSGHVTFTRKALRETMPEGTIPDDGDYEDHVFELLDANGFDPSKWDLTDVHEVDEGPVQLGEVTME